MKIIFLVFLFILSSQASAYSISQKNFSIHECHAIAQFAKSVFESHYLKIDKKELLTTINKQKDEYAIQIMTSILEDIYSKPLSKDKKEIQKQPLMYSGYIFMSCMENSENEE